jgi:hypothetical protein
MARFIPEVARSKTSSTTPSGSSTRHSEWPADRVRGPALVPVASPDARPGGRAVARGRGGLCHPPSRARPLGPRGEGRQGPNLSGRTWSRGGKEMRDPFDQARKQPLRAPRCGRRAHAKARAPRAVRPWRRGRVSSRTSSQAPCRVNSDPRVLVDAPDILDALPARIEDAFKAWARSETHLVAERVHGPAGCPDAEASSHALCAGAESERGAPSHRSDHARPEGDACSACSRTSVCSSKGPPDPGRPCSRSSLPSDAGRPRRARVVPVLQPPPLCVAPGAGRSTTRRARRAGALAGDLVRSTACARRSGPASATWTLTCRSTGEQAFWDDEVPLIMEQALEVLRARGRARDLFDAVVVDEAQDFAPDWWANHRVALACR